MRVLVVGCGPTGRVLALNAEVKDPDIIRLDADPACTPDIVCVLGRDPIPLADNSVDLIVAIHVLEHIGRQGETTEWFQFWEEAYRVLRPDGHLEFQAPRWDRVWAWADPTHTRALSPEAFIFFAQDNYRVGGSSISPYRIRCDFMPEGFVTDPDADHFAGVLRAVKPFRPWWTDEAM